MNPYGHWNSKVFASVGAVLGAAYGLFVAEVVGLVSYANLSLLVLGLLFGALMGAVLVGGVAAARNYIGHQSERFGAWVRQVRRTSPAPKTKPNTAFQLKNSAR